MTRLCTLCDQPAAIIMLNILPDTNQLLHGCFCPDHGIKFHRKHGTNKWYFLRQTADLERISLELLRNAT